MCDVCINFINNIYKYRKKCEETQSILQNRYQEKDVKVEPETFKEEGTISIDITDLLSIDNSFKDYNHIGAVDDYNDSSREDTSIQETPEDEIFPPHVKDVMEKPVKVIEGKKNGRTEKTVRKKVKEKREKERVREKIECEYCHKILTSKLSLRNHYKIHTGFDVVCEVCVKVRKCFLILYRFEIAHNLTVVHHLVNSDDVLQDTVQISA